MVLPENSGVGRTGGTKVTNRLLGFNLFKGFGLVLFEASNC